MNANEEKIIQTALKILARHQKSTDLVIHRQLAVDFFRIKFGVSEREIFSVMFLNNQNQLISFEELFYGSVKEARVYPREVVKRALALNASGVILTHNHPGGCTEPSDNDISATKQLEKILALIDVRVVDHIIIASGGYVSFEERGLL